MVSQHATVGVVLAALGQGNGGDAAAVVGELHSFAHAERAPPVGGTAYGRCGLGGYWTFVRLLGHVLAFTKV
ncbi:hypothetical protein GCM10009824_13780 [Kocuria atrinae]|uniref:Uncharacterized protein n=1 Tax=Kocuria atrinae TaxID=592377 RepID=A0ABN2XR62_9MICC